MRVCIQVPARGLAGLTFARVAIGHIAGETSTKCMFGSPCGAHRGQRDPGMRRSASTHMEGRGSRLRTRISSASKTGEQLDGLPAGGSVVAPEIYITPTDS